MLPGWCCLTLKCLLSKFNLPSQSASTSGCGPGHHRGTLLCQALTQEMLPVDIVHLQVGAWLF